ncbi:MAG TPA: glycoside hydrolase family 43 protein [Candidatus Paceibacterota bacterium]|nr:glycoside hydrolase family 43 protein [Candidatus Paceibacterota bacterium]
MEVTQTKPVHANPVYGSYFADPFVWKSGGSYYAIGTGSMEANGGPIGKIFPVLQSEDFFQWRFASNALIRPDPALGTHFWAPEVVQHDGHFYLYYSVGHGDKNHQLRVAIGDSPQGPYRDLGKALLNPVECPFAIDAHPFQDEDGQWYLFYARDFLDVTPQARAGTAVMVARMKSMTELEDAGRVMIRARHDWQRFQANRPMYDQVWDWHTIEGPFVRRHGGRYYCFYSGGRWENETYGVDYCVAEHILGPYIDDSTEAGPRVLRTVPGQTIGPGHNSIVVGPGDAEYLVYHAWDKDMKARQMFIDRLIWTAEGPRCEGPTWGAAFNAPTV